MPLVVCSRVFFKHLIFPVDDQVLSINRLYSATMHININITLVNSAVQMQNIDMYY